MSGRGFAYPLLLFIAVAAEPPREKLIDFSGQYARSWNLTQGQVVEVSAGLPSPSQLPPNGRLAVEFAGYRKVIHALDPDFFVVYRAPKTGRYTLKVTPVEDEDPVFNLPRWRESGSIQKMDVFPRQTPWPADLELKLRANLTPVQYGASKRNLHVEMEPNDSIAEAQPIALGASGQDETIHVTGGADDIEYFDNGKIGTSGLDWFRIEYKGKEPRLFTANLTVPDPLVVSQVVFYTQDGKEYREGANANERVHQQTEGHRTEISRILKPGGLYFLKAEANSPGYDLELRLRRPAPYTDPREAVRQAMYDHLAQVDAWLLNRPRGASVDRRIRDTGSLLGTGCMSCHTQSGVWGPAGPMLNGYRPENVANFRHLINVMYESLRPTNVLQDAANNTSLAPLDLGDGPAGTRVAGYNVTTLESFLAPRQLHSAQQIRTANHVLQSNDPSGVNAAGPGSNVGQAVVYRFTGEILRRAWEKTGDRKYLAALEDKARKILSINLRYSDDLSNRILFFKEVLPADYVALRQNADEAKDLYTRGMAQIEVDERRLRQTQRAGGAWGFDPGELEQGAWKWVVRNADPQDIDPAPTALALTALHALGRDDTDPAVARGVKALLAMQEPCGRWNRNALTGFVTTAYALHALARLYPEKPSPPRREDFEPQAGETLADTIGRLRALAQLGLSAGDARFLDLVLPGAAHTNPHVRYWAQTALGALHNERGIEAQIRGLGDPVKMVREAARWGLRQTLLDDKGWDFVFHAYETGGDLTREAIAGALIMRADGVLSRSSAGFPRLSAVLDRMMNDDASPAVRAWAARAAWNWWVWNPPVRDRLNAAFIRALERSEPSALAQTALRYQAEALFIANGQRANGSKDHQYPQLAKLFAAISKRLDSNPNENLVRRLVRIAATYYSQAGGDGGPGQMGYVTPHAAEMMGKAVTRYWNEAEQARDRSRIRLSVEAAANVTYDPLQAKLLDYSTNGPEDLRTLASTSISDPRLVTLNAAQEFVEPLIAQIQRGAQEPERRTELVQPILRLFTRARWNLPKSAEQQRIFYDLMLPRWAPGRGKLDENTRELLQMEKDSTDWYLARAMGGVLHSNPDLHTDELVGRFPKQFATPMEEMLWLPSVKWLLHYDTPVPEVEVAPPDSGPLKEVRDRAVDLLIKQLTAAKVDRRLRDTALRLSADIPVRNDARVREALKKVRPAYVEDELPEVASMPEAWKRNFEYFRNWVAPELMRPAREDELACLSCHGVPGRVPSMKLAAPDNAGFINMKSVYENYLALMERVNESNVEQSKLLRKPLNVQSGQEDGHQGGRRYSPNDRGYQILRRWVLDVAALKQGGRSVTQARQ
ncbi:MAG: HEAT repeat domain-containing protein [Acidobacteria bacterium]|nr:HEAT repeat domain-containing protein [Acidobacteriota bacterium]